MARIELRDATIIIKDGLSGTGKINEATPGSTDTDVGVDTLVLNSTDTDKIPIGARFNVGTAGNTTKYTVTARTNSTGVDEVQSLSASGATGGTFTLAITLYGETSAQTTAAISYDAAPAAIQTAVDTALAAVSTYVAGDLAVTGASTADLGVTTFTFSGTSVAKKNHAAIVIDGASLTGGGSEAITTTTEGQFVDQTTNITFTPAWGTPTPADDDTITFLPQEVAIKIGDGNLTYTRSKDYEYLLDRGVLDTVKEQDEIPMDVTIDGVYEFVTTGTGENITPVDAMYGEGGASEFVSASSDLCEPYCVDIQMTHAPSCGATQNEVTVFPDFRADTAEFDISDATISFTGRCKATKPTVTRVTA